jgi:hypothetical protein
MSFGIATGDFVAVMNLAWRLHQDFYKVLQDCPQEIKDLSRDLATIYGVLKHIQEDLESDESIIQSHGQGRRDLMQSMVKNLNETLKGLQKLVSNFHSLAVEGRRRDQMWSKVKWVVSQKKISRIHQDLTFHTASFNLILTSMGK